jgi:hypothetical protein
MADKAGWEEGIEGNFPLNKAVVNGKPTLD